MRSIDIHAHLTPQCFIHAMQAGQEWHGIRPGSVRLAPRAVWTPEQRIADMHSLGVDVQVVSTGAGFYYYDRDAQTVAAMHRECNDEVHQMTIDHPERFKGFAQIPMQDAYLSKFYYDCLTHSEAALRMLLDTLALTG
jgi:predicted TIM-barrel fold metal-dependent hydrolase